MTFDSPLLINEPPLQVLPSLACKIGLNEAIVLQQLHYLLRDPRHGRKIAEHQWIFNTYEQWVANYFPFWCVRTVKTVFSNLARMNLVVSCQPEGRLSRRKYYRINMEELSVIADRAKFVPSNGQESSLPSTKTTVQRLTKESKETAAVAAGSLSDFKPTWKPDERSRQEKLKGIKTPRDYPSERFFDAWVDDEGLDNIAGRVSDLYGRLCDHKWHHWNGRRWVPIRDWKSYVRSLETTVEGSLNRF